MSARFRWTTRRRELHPPFWAEEGGFEPQFGQRFVANQLRNPLRNRGKTGVERGRKDLLLREKTALNRPAFPPGEGFESLRFRQNKSC